MVHALEEVHRVLAVDGVLIDLRPVADRWPVEIISSGRCWPAGRLDDLPQQLADDAASNAALDQARLAGSFVLERQETFDFSYYWDSLQEMRDYVDAEWVDFCALPGSVFEQALAIWDQIDPGGQARVRLKMQLGVWRRTMV